MFLSDSEDSEECEMVTHDPEPLDGLEALSGGQAAAATPGDEDFLKALYELCYYCEF